MNKLGCIISTKYPTFNNPFEDEVGYAKRVLDRIEDDETIFALLYEPDEEILKLVDEMEEINRAEDDYGFFDTCA